jgi:hypothetical protein
MTSGLLISRSSTNLEIACNREGEAEEGEPLRLFLPFRLRITASSEDRPFDVGTGDTPVRDFTTASPPRTSRGLGVIVDVE